MSSFFNKNYQTPCWLTKKLSRRSALKAAAGSVALSTLPSFSQILPKEHIEQKIKQDPWSTLDAVLNHLLPVSEDVEPSKDISAKSIQATAYLINVVEQQPTEVAEVEFIYKGVGWLNDYTQLKQKQNFIALTHDDKETMLRAISLSTAGSNWLNNLIGYIYQAMLSPPVYGGNPNGIGWQWLEHQPGYPLPKVGSRFYELPGVYAASPVAIKRNKA